MEEPYVHKIFLVKQELKGPFLLRKHGFLNEIDIHKSKSLGMDKAVFTYPIKHYSEDHTEGRNSEDSMGTIGENFAVLEMDEFTVFIGDTFRMGEAIIQVSQPGPVTAKHLQNGLNTGWYFRVVQEGEIRGGTDLELIDRPYPQWSIAACTEVIFLDKHNLRAADELYSCELLGGIWRNSLRKRLRGF
ncbi:MOSC domain-containing protein [Oceanobacillus damuensis]|uniref:MOSC domain-containing protein n=1 Tax=Oceanobacillus damuensis TaxID=937928 RepID=UPI00082E5ADD|nr:MOSC domain-containing protein [Oceanobacillus damuensis]